MISMGSFGLEFGVIKTVTNEQHPSPNACG